MDRFRLVIPAGLFAEVVAHAQSDSPVECCGLLAGRLEEGAGRVLHRFALRNTAASGTEYAADVQELLAVQKVMRAAGVRELAVYHSHPTAPAVPSRRDLERNGYGEAVVHLIVGTDGVRGWWLLADGYGAADVEIREDSEPPS